MLNKFDADVKYIKTLTVLNFNKIQGYYIHIMTLEPVINWKKILLPHIILINQEGVYMKVIKKNGDIQEFNKEKISISIYNASCDTEYGFLNSSDLKVILDDILNTLYSVRKNDGYTSSYEIYGITVNSLKKNGFHKIMESYSTL